MLSGTSLKIKAVLIAVERYRSFSRFVITSVQQVVYKGKKKIEFGEDMYIVGMVSNKEQAEEIEEVVKNFVIGRRFGSLSH